MSIQIRPARASERLQIVDLGRSFHESTDLDLPFCPSHAALTVAAYTAAPDKLALVAVNEDARVVGALLAAVGPSPISPVLISQELAWWVAPDFRGRSPLRMLDAYEEWADSLGCAALGLAALGDPRLARLYRARGFLPVENHFLKVLK